MIGATRCEDPHGIVAGQITTWPLTIDWVCSTGPPPHLDARADATVFGGMPLKRIAIRGALLSLR